MTDTAVQPHPEWVAEIRAVWIHPSGSYGLVPQDMERLGRVHAPAAAGHRPKSSFASGGSGSWRTRRGRSAIDLGPPRREHGPGQPRP